jgi:N-acetylated-alpha-linked acidic dipeptidase
MKRLSFLLIPLCLVLLLLPASALASTSFNHALDRLIAQGWPQRVDEHLAYMPGTNPQLGFYFGGTWSDDARARYIADRMRRMGLKHVHLEPVPVDTFNFESASVQVGTKAMIASTFAGSPPTPVSGLTASVVWAHAGTAQDFDALAAAGVDVKDKLVLVDADPNNWWMNEPQAEATSRGAIGVIFTYGPNTAPYWSYALDELASFDLNGDLTDVPVVYISQQDGSWLESQLDANGVGPAATMKLIEKVRLATQGGTGYNVFGDLPGRVKDDTFVLYGAHHDGFFHTGTDNTSGCVSNLLMAKAMMESGYRPAHTVRFMFTTAEEFGLANAYYDWCIGSWWAISHQHPAWAGRIRAFINVDHWTLDGKLVIRSAEFVPLLTSMAGASSSLLPNGYQMQGSSTWQDTWTFEAAGVPIVTFMTKQAGDPRYHSQYMTPDLMNWPYTGGLIKFIFAVEKQVNNGGLLPYGLSARADGLASTVVPADLLAAGADATAVNRLQGDIADLQTAAAGYEARAGSIPRAHYATVNGSLLAIWKKFNVQLMGLNPYQSSGFRHEQALLDVQSLNEAISALQQSVPDTAAALSALGNVDLTYYGTMLSHDVYQRLLTRADPGFYHVAWGSQANPVWPLLDVMPQYNAIDAGSWNATTITEIEAMRDQDLADLNSRLDAMSAAVEWVTTRIDSLN